MCVFNSLSKEATVSYTSLFMKFTDFGFKREIDLQQLYIEQSVNFLFALQDNIKPQLQTIKTNDKNFYDFISYPMERLDELRKFEKRLGSSPEEKRGEIPEEEKKLIKQVIKEFRKKNTALDGIKPESMQVLNESLNAGLKYWQTLQQKKDEAYSIFDPYAADFQKIENYEKKLKKCEYYKGFYFYSTGKLKFLIKDKNGMEIFSHKSPMLCLHQKEENKYYPHKYMVVCIDFQMEKGGASEEDAYKELDSAFNFYFQNIFRENNGLETISNIVEDKNIWKETFIELSGIGRKLKEVQNRDHTYNWKPVAGVSIGQ